MNQTRVTPKKKKKKEPRCFLSLFTPLNPGNLSFCFSFFCYECLTLAPRVALCLGSLPLALGGAEAGEAARKYFSQPEHKYSASQAEGPAPEFN